MSAVTSLVVLVGIAVAIYAVIRFYRSDSDPTADEAADQKLPNDAD